MTATGIDAALLALALSELPIGVIVAGPDGTIARATTVGHELLEGNLLLLDEAFAAALGGDESSGTLQVRDRTLSYELRPLRSGDAIVGAVAMVQDVSSQRRREHAERDFVANAAHELRTPIAAIASAVEVLEQGAKGLPVERDRFLAHIRTQSDRLERVIAALLTLARYDARVERPKLEIVPVRRILTAVAAGLVPAPDVTVGVRCAKEVAVLANVALLEEAISNIAANAVRYTERGSVMLTCRAHGDQVRIAITDTGRGIDVADHDRVFDRFFRSGSRDTQGFGLGLSIARRAIEACGGAVDLTSEQGKGTSVEIRLPLAHLLETS